MTANATITITGQINNLPSGSKTIGPLNIVSAAAIGVVQDLVLAVGANTITVPTGATGVIIVPPNPNANTLILKGVAGDTGTTLASTLPTLLCIATGVASFVLQASGLTAIELSWF